ncbi:MAG: hypothetical protein Q4D42_08345 [Eubacteriales bacterium]|nr:hypothetical protein [Eubacteriales bacterium]
MAKKTTRTETDYYRQKGVSSIRYHVKFQTEAQYQSIAYGQGSIYSSACGPASLCNALYTLGIADISIPTMCQLAVSCGARVEGGTVMTTLLRAAASKYHFQYSATSKNTELLAHLHTGGVAILHAGSAYPLFSTSGHFVTAVAASGQTITVLDSYWYGGKYTSSSIRRNYIHVVETGVVKTSLSQCGKATIDRNPSYYLISREMVTEQPTQESAKSEAYTMQYYKTLDDIPTYYRDTVKKLVEQGAIKGTGDGLDLSEDLCRAFTILDHAGLLPG